MSTTPTLIYAASTTSKAMVPLHTSAVGGSAQAYGPFAYGGNLYSVLQAFGTAWSPAATQLWVFKSTDAGATWAAVDGANGPTLNAGTTYPNASAHYDGADTVTVCFNDAATAPGTSQPLKLQDFDLASETWGAVYGTSGAPSCLAINQLFKRSDGSWIILHNRTFVPGFLPILRGLAASIYNSGAGTWGSDFDVDTNIPSGYTQNASSSAVYDPVTDVIHVFIPTRTAANLNGVSYQQINLDNSLGASFDFSNEFGYLGTGSTPTTMADPIIVGANIVLGVLDTTATVPTVLVGTPLANPSWSVLAAPGIDPNFPGGNTYNSLVPYLATDGATIYAIYVYEDFDAGYAQHVRLAQTTNTADPLSGWTGQEVYAGAGELFASPQYPGAVVADSGATVLMTVQGATGGQGHPSELTAFFLSLAVSETPEVVCDDPPPGIVGAAYSHFFPASGGTAPYAFAISDGDLPAGVEIDPDTGEASGTPTTPGTYSFTVQVTDENDATGTVSCSIASLPAGIKILLRGVRRMKKTDCGKEETDRCTPEPQRPKIDHVW
jgi:hypothetical protein